MSPNPNPTSNKNGAEVVSAPVAGSSRWRAGINWLANGTNSWLWVALAASTFALGTWVTLRQLSAPLQEGPTLPVVRLLGEPVVLDPKAPARALARLREHTSGLFALELPENDVQRVSYADLGAQIDKGHLAQLLRDTVDPTSPLSRWRTRNGATSQTPIDLPIPLVVERSALRRLLLPIKDEYDRPAVNARLDLESKQILPSKPGLLLNVDATALAIERALENNQAAASVVFETVAPDRTTEQLQGVTFDHVIAAFETPYDRSEKARERTFNLRLAASKLDGTVLLPGEEFDFNRIVGARDEANGYKVAAVIAQGELVDGIGGGTCQISGTLHAAAFFAGLDIVQRFAHTRPSSYIKLGLDATVVYPSINFRFRNPFDFPVVLHQSVKDGVVRAEVLGPDTGKTVTLIRRILSAIPYEEVERPDDRLEHGRRVLVQRGVPGFKMRMYRVIREGMHATREKRDVTYPPTQQVVLVGTAKVSSPKAPKETAQPEYTADELLVVTVLPNGHEEPKTLEKREPGPYGEPGWTQKLGMPFYRTSTN
jgi:vancomycin resistance protein YoaR